MKVLINGRIYDSKRVAIAILLEGSDKDNIKNMFKDCDTYIAYPDGIKDSEEMSELMRNVEKMKQL